jgi:precorrin-3B methylase
VEDKRVKEAIETLITYRKATTPVGIATNATTEHERARITTLGDVTSHDINSDALLIVDNSETPVFNRKMVTPRGYKKGVGYRPSVSPAASLPGSRASMMGASRDWS